MDFVYTLKDFGSFPEKRFSATMRRSFFGVGWSGMITTETNTLITQFYRKGMNSIIFENSFLPGVWKNTERSFLYCEWPGKPSGGFWDETGCIAYTIHLEWNRRKSTVNTVEHCFYKVIVKNDTYLIKHIIEVENGCISDEYLALVKENGDCIGCFNYWHDKIEWKNFDVNMNVLFMILVAYGFMRPLP